MWDQADKTVLAKASRCLDVALTECASNPSQIRSTVHLCWLLQGTVSSGVEVTDPRLATLLGELRNSQLLGWSWKLRDHNPTDAECAIYPTYMAIRVLTDI